MAITKSAKKAIRQTKRRRVRNLAYLTAVRKATKEAKTLIAQKKPKEAQAALAKAYSALDKAAKSGVIKKNHASRKKSRMAKALGRA